MKRLFFVACAAAALTFASCGSKNAEQKAAAAEQATEQAVEATQAAAAEEVKEVVNEALVALQNKLADLKTKAEAATKADAASLMAELTAIKGEIDAASLSEDEKKGLGEAFNAIVDICKNLK